MNTTARERVLNAVNHKEGPLAIDFGSTTSTSISIYSYIKLREYLGVGKGKLPRIYDFMLMLADVEPEILDIMGADIAPAQRLMPCRDLMGVDIRWKDFVPFTMNNGEVIEMPGEFKYERDASGTINVYDDDNKLLSRMPKNSFYFDQVGFPYEDIETPEEIDELHLTGMTDEEVSFIAGQAKELRRTSDRAVLLPFGGKMFENGQMKWGVENFLCSLLTAEDMVARYFDTLAEINIRDVDRIFAQAADDIDIIRFGDDLGSQSSLLCSPDTYRKLIKPYHKKVMRHIKDKYPNVKIGFHCCGAIFPLIGDLIDCGVDMLNPVQLSAKGMEPERLKAEYGRDITFWGGGAEMQFFIPNHSPEEIRDETRRLIDIFAKDGGFVFAASHNMQADTPVEKIMAIFETAKEYR